MAEVDKPYRDFDYSGYPKNLIIIVLLHIEEKKNGSRVFAS